MVAERENKRWGPHTAKFTEAFDRLEEQGDWDADYQARLAYAMDLEKLAIEIMGRRQDRESRWIQNALQYAGVYDAETYAQIQKRPGASELFVNLTRPKTTVLRSRITDVMLPEDSANWDIKSSPVPDLPEWALNEVREELEREAQMIAEQKATEAQAQQPEAAPEQEALPPQAEASPEQGGLLPQAGAAPEQVPQAEVTGSIHDLDEDIIFQFIKRKAEEIVDRARLVMTDQLKECGYAVELFKVIHEGAKYGTGVMKGPLFEQKTFKRWASRQAEDGSIIEERVETSLPRPVFRHVHCWDLYPDPEATSIEDAEYVFELHRWSRKQLRHSTKKIGFYRDAARRLLMEEPRLGAVYNNFHESLREIERDDRGGKSTRFHVWEYRGPADPDTIRPALDEMSDEGERLSSLLGLNEDDYDPLNVPNIVVYFCQGHLLLLELDILDTNELPYSMFTLDPDESSLYGEGIPGMVEHPQRALNAAWRLTMDTGALAGLPMFVVDDSIEPMDGVPEIRSGKLWRYNSQAIGSGRPSIEVIQINATVAESLEIASTARQLMNDESMIPLVAHGEASGNVQQTAHGMTLLSNAVNTTFRQIVRSIDLNLTTPNIRRLYQWNRQFGPEFIDGDVEIMALGSSVLLVREVQAGQRMTMLNLVSNDPELGDHVNKGELIRLLCYTMQLPHDKILYDREIVEIRRAQRLAAEQAAAEAAGQGKVQIEQMRQEGVQAVEATRQETELARMETQAQIAREKLEAEREKTRLKTQSEERALAVETLLRRKTGQGV